MCRTVKILEEICKCVTQRSNELANQYLIENNQKYENGTTCQ